MTLLLLLLIALTTSCQRGDMGDILSQTFVHKYGFETTEEDWNARAKEGQVVTHLKNGTTVTESYENGLLHGTCTVSFPDNLIVEKRAVYDQGILLKESISDIAGMPIREEIYGPDRHTTVTLWDEKGVPISVEEYDLGCLTDGKYYNPEHELEAAIDAGSGERVKRDRTGLLVFRETVENGDVTSRTTYHPNGATHTISHYRDLQLHGQQLKFTATGKPLMELYWNEGVLDGQKTIFRNGIVVATIPYINGQKLGTEYHFDDLGNLTAEIEWRDDKKHGSTKLYDDEKVDAEWFFKGQSVSLEKFQNLEERDLTQAEIQAVR